MVCHGSDLRPEAIEQLILLNMDAAVSIAWRYRYRGIALEDLEQTALMALVMAAHRFHHSQRREFLTFAAPIISREIKKHIRDCGWMLLPPGHTHSGWGNFAVISLDALISDQTGAVIGYLVADVNDRAEGAADARIMVGSALRGLTRQDRLIVRLRFSDGLTQTEIATILGVSQNHVSRLLGRIIAELRATLTGGEALAA